MDQEIDYAEMLEIPVSTVNVVKKKGLFQRNRTEKPAKGIKATAEVQDELKEMVVDSVNERVGAYVYAEDLSEPPKPEKKKFSLKGKKDGGSIVLFTEVVAACAIAAAIFLTNVFMPDSAINTFIGSFTGKKAEAEPTYNQITLSSVVSDFSDADVAVSENGVISFTAKGGVYPVCDGKVSSVVKEEAGYTVQIAHTSTFSSVITGLTSVYKETGSTVKANLPFAYSDGETQVKISMYDGDTLLNCYTLSGEVPVWNS